MSGVQPGVLGRPAARVSITPPCKAGGSSSTTATTASWRPTSSGAAFPPLRCGRRVRTRGTDPRVERPRVDTRSSSLAPHAPYQRPGGGPPWASNGASLGSIDESGSSGETSLVVSSDALSRRATLCRVNATATVAINPPRSTRIGTALLLGSTSVGVSALLTTRNLDAIPHGIWAATCRALRTSRKASWPPTSAWSPSGPVGEVALIVIIGVAAFTVDGTCGGGDRKRSVLDNRPPSTSHAARARRRRRHWWQEWRRHRSGSQSDPCRPVTC